VGIVFGVARSEKPRSKSASAPAKPGGFEAPQNYPFILRDEGVRFIEPAKRRR